MRMVQIGIYWFLCGLTLGGMALGMQDRFDIIPVMLAAMTFGLGGYYLHRYL